ncbi:copper fist DNA binding domain-containing protein [Nannizzia gypsea CBS 118893]|uniref:Copper fist DNA binding domain-containing protein n=1 Tax=Arthroderma gypseum (strain ATCC MYA-4604 / CBS 118893) TaxID=535722 RepID=E5R150_ARTGP|nr:copper fist DNA binding domain-containing protein [Nannizzia gypsea CBS 118893]EFQ98439.1 copper fist DNA binding domain-containing protein [Nannizzia gypsea CBS 118893]
MLIDGEKWACDACIRGHRVSTCNHSDRPLSHINKKGRPVSQCPHCRGLRKARTSHAKCECGEKPHSKAECPLNGTAADGQKTAGGRKLCCCGHGGRCTCASKRDSNLETVPETGPVAARRSTVSGVKRPHITTSKKQKEASKRAHPYPLPRSRTIHGTADLARLSMDHLNDGYSSQNVSSYPDLVTSAPRPVRRVKSENGSPVSEVSDMKAQLSLDIPYQHFPDQMGLSMPIVDYPQQSPGLYYPSDIDFGFDAAISNGPSIDWSTFDLPYGSDAYTATYSQPASYASYDYNNNNNNNTSTATTTFGHPGLARSSSGDTSDADDLLPIVGTGSEAGMYHLGSTPPSHLDLPTQFAMSQTYEPAAIEPVLHAANDSIDQTSASASVSVSAEAAPLPAELGHHYHHQQSTQTQTQAQTAQTYPASGNSFVDASNAAMLIPPAAYTSAGANEPLWVSTAYPAMMSPVSVSIPDQHHHHQHHHQQQQQAQLWTQ